MSPIVEGGLQFTLQETEQGRGPTPTEADEPLLKFFKWSHLPPALQVTSQPFCKLAEAITLGIPRNAERTVALRKLLEAKDAAVRAALP